MKGNKNGMKLRNKFQNQYFFLFIYLFSFKNINIKNIKF